MEMIPSKVKWTIRILSSLTLLVGIADFVASIIVIRTGSSNLSTGAWYVGLACINSGFMGLRLSIVPRLTQIHVKWTAIAAALSSGNMILAQET